ncbi:MAG: hypothetical protein WDZ68_01205, partial [Candidatus Paceibacterota bacterium]
MNNISYRILIAGLLGIVTAFLVSSFYNPFQESVAHTDDGHSHSDNDKVHVHADFLFYIQDEQVDLTDDKYQSVEGAVKHLSFHLHDNIGHVLHRHAVDITLADFLSSIGFELTDNCIVHENGVKYCTDTENELRLYVNGGIHETPSEYVTQEGDQILLYYGDPDSSRIATYLEEITEEACIYSGTCPLRGTPPPESCG